MENNNNNDITFLCRNCGKEISKINYPAHGDFLCLGPAETLPTKEERKRWNVKVISCSEFRKRFNL